MRHGRARPVGAPRRRCPRDRRRAPRPTRCPGIKVRWEPVDDPDVKWRGDQLSEDVRLACFDQVNRSTRRGALFGPVAAVMLVVIFGHAVPVAGMAEWAATVTVVTGVTVWSSELYLRRRRLGQPVGRWLAGPVTAGLCGLAWASLPALRVPVGQPLRPAGHLPDRALRHLRGQRGGNRSVSVLLLPLPVGPAGAHRSWCA